MVKKKENWITQKARSAYLISCTHDYSCIPIAKFSSDGTNSLDMFADFPNQMCQKNVWSHLITCQNYGMNWQLENFQEKKLV